MREPTKEWVEKKVQRLDFLAKLFDERGLPDIAEDIREIQDSKSIQNFYDCLKMWIF